MVKHQGVKEMFPGNRTATCSLNIFNCQETQHRISFQTCLSTCLEMEGENKHKTIHFAFVLDMLCVENWLEALCKLELWINFSLGLRLGGAHASTKVNYFGCQLPCPSCVLRHGQCLATPWTAAHQSPLSMGFPRQEYYSGLPFPPLRDLPDPGIKPTSSASLALGGRFFTAESPRKPWMSVTYFESRTFLRVVMLTIQGCFSHEQFPNVELKLNFQRER